jgi:hypothetical protein
MDVGEVFGRLTLLRKLGRLHCYCRCICGSEVTVLVGNLRRGRTKSCGCLRRESSKKLGRGRTTHGETTGGRISPEYLSWTNMLRRCYDKHDISYSRYGHRGIGVCSKWRKSFAAFLVDVGRKPSKRHTLDRRDNSRGYEPGNVRWVTHEDQQSNKRSNVFLTYLGKTRTLSQWSRALKIPTSTLSARHANGLSVERTLCREDLRCKSVGR